MGLLVVALRLAATQLVAAELVGLALLLLLHHLGDNGAVVENPDYAVVGLGQAATDALTAIDRALIGVREQSKAKESLAIVEFAEIFMIVKARILFEFNN